MDRRISNKECLSLVLYEIYNERGEEWFTEFELTVKAWEMFEDRFGLRGYEKKYPNHKSVCNLYMSGKKDSNAPIPLGWIIKHPAEKNMYQVGTPAIVKAKQIHGRMGVKSVKEENSRDSSIEKINDGNSKIMILEQRELTSLWRSAISPCMRYYLKNGEISPDFNSSIDFLGLRNVGRSQSSKINNTHKKDNQSKLNAFRNRIINCLENNNIEEVRMGVRNKKYKLERKKIIQMANLYNLIIIRWEGLISRMIMDKLESIDLSILVEEGLDNGSNS